MSKMKNKNSTMKILALFISILLWSYVRNEVNPKIIREFKGIEVEIMNQRLLNQSDLLLLEPKEVKIAVKVSGRRSDVNSIDKKEIIAEIDLSEAREGTQKIPVDVNVPFKVDLEDISDRYISFEIDKLVSVDKEVDINMSGGSKGDVIKDSLISPSSIKISGPSILVNKVSRVLVDINVDKIDSSDIMKLPIKVVDGKGKKIEGIKTNTDMVEVSVSLLKSKQVPIKPSVVEGSEETAKLSKLIPSTVTIKGLEKDIKDVKEITTEDINVAEVQSVQSDQNINVNLILPEGVSVDNGKETVEIELKTNLISDVELEKEILVPIEQISLENVKEGLNASLGEGVEDNISLKIKGEKSIIDSLTPEDIKLSLDLNGLDEGVQPVKLLVSSLKEITIESITPEIVETNLEAIE